MTPRTMPSEEDELLMFGKHNESGFWVASAARWRFMFFGHDSLYIALGKLRIRIMKPTQGSHS